MKLFNTFQIEAQQRGFHFINGQFVDVLQPGRHRFSAWLTNHRVEILMVNDHAINNENLSNYLTNERFRAETEVVELTQRERALVWRGGVLQRILGPGRHVFWKTDAEIRIDRLNVTSEKFSHPQLDVILRHPDAQQLFYIFTVSRGKVALLFVNEIMKTSLEPGRYSFWQGSETYRIELIELREQQVDVTGQEILTQDNVTLRLNLVASWQIVDPLKMISTVTNLNQAVYRELQIALRTHVGSMSLSSLLADKESTGLAVTEAVRQRFENFGVKICQVGLKDVILPGEMKRILNQVIEAENEARANLVTRREETAATRSLQNTAKLIENNPVLLRLKELEVAERIAAQIDTIHISRGIDELVSRLVPNSTS